MKDKVRIRLYAPPSLQAYEVRLPHCLRVDQVVPLVLRLLAGAREPVVGLSERSMLMLTEGDAAGLVAHGQELVGDLVGRGILRDGALVALV